MIFSSILFSFSLYSLAFTQQFYANLRLQISDLRPYTTDELPEISEVDFSYYIVYLLLVFLLIAGTSMIVLLFMNYKEEDIPQSYIRAI